MRFYKKKWLLKWKIEKERIWRTWITIFELKNRKGDPHRWDFLIMTCGFHRYWVECSTIYLYWEKRTGACDSPLVPYLYYFNSNSLIGIAIYSYCPHICGGSPIRFEPFLIHLQRKRKGLKGIECDNSPWHIKSMLHSPNIGISPRSWYSMRSSSEYHLLLLLLFLKCI